VRTEARIFNAFAMFFFLAAPFYAWWTDYEEGRIEFVGTIELLLTGVLLLMLGLFFEFVHRRIDPRPEDRPDAEMSDGAGEVGFFSAGSYWPFGIGLAVGVAGLGLAVWQWWLTAAGLVAVLVTVSGLLFEYYTGTRRSPE
jgi:cytochrome c oxidase subunit IV